MSWGTFRCYIKGTTGKWSALRQRHVMYYGEDRLTREQALANAELELAYQSARHPGREIELREWGPLAPGA